MRGKQSRPISGVQHDGEGLDNNAILQVLLAVQKGDFSVRLPSGWTGINGKIADTLNDIIETNERITKEVESVSYAVGTEGKLSRRTSLVNHRGSWKTQLEAINSLIDDLARPTTEMARVIGAVAKGDLTQTVALEAEARPLKGQFLTAAKTVNAMVKQLEAFAAEVTRVAREVGTEGKLGGQAVVRGVAGTWKDLTDSVNLMAGNLTDQVRNIADVTIAVANGDLSKKITVDVRGEILQLKEAINTMVDQLRSFASEVTRVAREVGTEGKLGGQAQVRDVSGVWKDLTESVNMMAGNLTAQVRNIADVTIAVANGDLSKKITVDVRGEILQLKDTINTMVDQLRSFAAEVTRVAREVGTEGKLGGQAVVPGVAGTWKDLTDSVNAMASNLTAQVRNIAEVTIAVANGDLSKKITVDVRGEILQLKAAINTMVDQLNAFAAEVTRVAREVGTEGKLGGQAVVPGVAGTWKDLTDNVNVMAANLTAQVRGIVKVVTAVANGSLKEKLTVEAKGEVAALAETINNMTDTLGIFAEQVTTVAREVGVEGRLGGQANVPGVAGIWKDLTDNVNLLAANLTTQVRAIADVATAVTKGDLTRSIQVDARGEVAELKDNINAMIQNLRATTEQNTEQDWLKTNLGKFTSMLQGQRDLTTVGRMLLSELAPLVNAQYGAIYQMDSGSNGDSRLQMLAGYARGEDASLPSDVPVGFGLVGQCALEKRRILLNEIPADYVRIGSGLGDAPPRNLIVLPVLFEGQTKAVIELASLAHFTSTHLTFLAQLTESIGIVLNTIEATMRTEGLLQQSQKLAVELQAQQKELQQTNEELATKAKQLAEQNAEVERKNREIEQARHAVEEKAAELALASKYKSEFLANMSHELRTPLNSILILAQQLADNREGNLNGKQVEFARNVHAAGADLLNLISDILDLSKIESGTVTVEPEEVPFGKVRDAVERSFRHVAEARQLAFDIDLDPQLRGITTDIKRLQQVLKNLLSNAFKFTMQGRVSLRIVATDSGWSFDHATLNASSKVIAFEVRDTGIGIPPDKQKIIFEAFHQADAGTSRRFGGTGLGLAISRELATLLGGEIKLVSVPGQGSTFTMYLPEQYMGAAPGAAIKGSDMPAPAPLIVRQAEKPEEIPDDRHEIVTGDPVVLIVEDDPHFARVLLGLVREKGFKGVVSNQGGLVRPLARQYNPLAITLDIFLPDMLGWTVLSHLKQDPATRHIPVQIITVEEERMQGLGHGAFSYLIKPSTTDELRKAADRVLDYAQSTRRNLLIVEDNEIERQSVVELLGHDSVDITTASTGAEAWSALRNGTRFDCVVLDLRLPDISGFELLERIREEPELRDLPIVVFTGKDLSEEDEIQLLRMAESVILKGVQSPERLLDETSLFLHLVESELPQSKQDMLKRLRQTDEALVDKKVLVVDDDVRNIFALTSLLEQHGLNVVSRETGAEAIEMLAEDQDIDAVLMDIMMPEMDGYETMRRIRKNPRHRLLPILALTAKAMKGDREKCLEAGASDYIAKPVDTDELLALLRIWLFGKQPLTRKPASMASESPAA